MGDAKNFIAGDEAPVVTPLLGTEPLCQDMNAHRAYLGSAAKVDRVIAVVEGRAFVRECIRRSMQPAFSLPVITYSTLADLDLRDASAELLMLSLIDTSAEACASTLKAVSELAPSIPIVVLGSTSDVDVAHIAIRHGARGYIPCTMEYDITVEAVRLILAGGTYVPVDCLLATGRPNPETQISAPARLITSRELAVVRAIQQGKSNKVIAYELNVCESTVKVHVRNVMKKLRAKNRTEVAIKAQTDLGVGACTSSG
jgi:DNA-binding NarL/FixJ family response regulator